jgi:hypothetical protein
MDFQDIPENEEMTTERSRGILHRMRLSNRTTIEEIVRKTSTEFFCLDPKISGNQNMTAKKNPFEDKKRLFNKRSRSIDRPVSLFVFC